MGIISSTLASLAIRIIWNCQRILDPHYRSLEQPSYALSPPPKTAEALKSTESSFVPYTESKAQDKEFVQGVRDRRVRQIRYRQRPSSFDTALIVQRTPKNVHHQYSLNTSNTPNSAKRIINVTHPSCQQNFQRTQLRDPTSSSGCSSDSRSETDTESEGEIRVFELSEEKPQDTDGRRECYMSPAEEAAFRLTVGRGHFSRSKKDKFLNHLRLEKRLNDRLHKEFFGEVCRARKNTLHRYYSGDLHRIV